MPIHFHHRQVECSKELFGIGVTTHIDRHPRRRKHTLSAPRARRRNAAGSWSASKAWALGEGKVLPRWRLTASNERTPLAQEISSLRFAVFVDYNCRVLVLAPWAWTTATG